MGRKFFTVGTFFGIQLRIDYSWFIIFALIAWTIITSYIPSYKPHLSAFELTAAGLAVTVLFFICVVAHEYAHSLVANRRGLKIRRITLFVFGGASELQHEPTTAKTELLMTAAGPATSLVLAAVFAGLWELTKYLRVVPLEIIFEPLAALNLVVAVFNLIPAFPLDGGRLLRSIIWQVKKDFIASTHAATNTGIVFSSLMLAFGLFEIAVGDLIGGLWIGIIGFFLLQSARFSYWQTLNQRILDKVRVADIASAQFVTVPAAATVSDFLNRYVLLYKQSDFLVTDPEDNLLGIIELNKVKRRPGLSGDEPIDTFVEPLGKDLILSPRDKATKALRIMQAHNLDLLPVMEKGSLHSIVLKSYLEDYIAVRRINPSAKK